MKKINFLIFPISIFLLTSCNNIVYNSESSITDTSSNVIEGFTITYDANGGQGSMENQKVNSREFSLNENKFYKPGYNFLGWTLAAVTAGADLTTAQYVAGQNKYPWNGGAVMVSNFYNFIWIFTNQLS